MPLRSSIPGAFRGLLFGLAIALAPARALAQAPDAGNAAEKWPYALPLFGDALSGRGIRMPLPIGLGVNYAFADQPIKISRLAVGANDSEMVDMTNFIVFDDLNSRVHALNFRADLWVLPFLNLYGMGNYLIQAETDVSIIEPFAFNAGAKQSGYGGGFGFTAAGGALGFFGTLDLNWTWNKMENLDAPVGTFLLTPRIGKNLGKHGGIEWIVWVGAMRQSIASETKGQINLNDAVDGAGDGSFQDRMQAWFDGLPPSQQAIVRRVVDEIQAGRPAGGTLIRYDLDKSIAYPWNLLVGGEFGLSRAWRLRAEVGFIHRTQLVLGLNYRFGGFTSGR